MRVRTLEAHEVALHRDVRLQALQEAPDAFGESFADAAARPMSYWDDLTRSVTEPGRHVMFLVCENETVVGCTYGLVDQARSEWGRVGGMWVDPAWRRRGIGMTMLQAVVAWARDRGLRRLGLWAADHSPAPVALYHKVGFREAGVRRPLPTNPALEIVEMHCEL